jgi:hypothetical protein
MDSNHLEISLVPTTLDDRLCGLRRLILSKVPNFYLFGWRIVVKSTGIEPATHWLIANCSIQ